MSILDVFTDLTEDLTARAEQAESRVAELEVLIAQIHDLSTWDEEAHDHGEPSEEDMCDALVEIHDLSGCGRSKVAAKPIISRCSDGTDPDEPSDRGFICIHEAERDKARNELVELINYVEHRNMTDACTGDWERCWCDTCESRRTEPVEE